MGKLVFNFFVFVVNQPEKASRQFKLVLKRSELKESSHLKTFVRLTADEGTLNIPVQSSKPIFNSLMPSLSVIQFCYCIR